MAEGLIEKKKKMEIMQLELNILKLETKYLEIDEEKIKILDNIKEQKQKLKSIKEED